MATAQLISLYGFSESWTFWEKLKAYAITWRTGSKFFHTELIIGRKRITSHTKNGVTIEDTLNLEYFKEFAEIKDIEIEEDRIAEAIAFAYKQENKGYDWKGILLSQTIPVDIHDKEKWFCNEICGEVLKIAGAKGIVEDTNEYNPGSFQELF